MPQLVKVKVSKLLWQFDHVLEIPPEWDFAILYGPNGVGKTKLLELIEATLKQQFRRLSRIPFEHVELTFDDGAVLSVARVTPEETENDEEILQVSANSILMTLKRPGEAAVKWNSANMPRRVLADRARELEMFDAPIQRMGTHVWRDRRTGERLDASEVIERFSEYSPRGRRLLGITPPPVEARKFLDSLSVYLIETQRLLASKKNDHRTIGEESEGDEPTVVRFAEDLARRLRDAMTENSRVSQKLDSAFPRQVLEASRKPSSLTDDQIRQRYDEQSELREQLAEIAVLDAAPEVPLPKRALEKWEQSFLWKYLDDTDVKLSSFKPLLQRVQLLRDIVNSRFLFKKMRIDRGSGFLFTTEAGHEIPATALSSGEQHEIVLAYNLLFMVNPGSLVLIDEPEISLHVTWQQDFIGDLRRISEITKLRFLIATHSPQVIHHWAGRAKALKPFTLDD